MLRHIKKSHLNYAMMIIIGAVLALLLGFTVYRLYYHTKIAVNYTISKDVELLEQVLMAIDADCEITSLANKRNYIDFLQVSTFVGSRVGPLNLRNPSRWQGPYLEQNPEIDGKAYEIVKVHEGYAIVPGAGVRLANGKTIGKDLIITETTDLDSLINETAGLEWQGKPLAIHLKLTHLTQAPRSDVNSDEG